MMASARIIFAAFAVGCAPPAGPHDEEPDADPLEDTVPVACDSLEGEGFEQGQIAADWTLTDHNGDLVSLHDFCGRVIFYEEGSEW